MKCPFPGMDPFLEYPSHWQDFHNSFLVEARVQLQAKLGEPYLIRVEEDVRLVQKEPDGKSLLRADLGVARRREPVLGGGLALAEPLALPLDEPDWIEIKHLRLAIVREPDLNLVTVIELLSPWNKNDGFAESQAKRGLLLRRYVHWVEIDLLAGGKRTPLAVARPPGDYFSHIVRHTRRREAEVVAWGVRERLPTIPIPLSAPDPDVRLDLATAFAETYERAGFARLLARSHRAPLEAPLAAEDRAWAEALATGSGASAQNTN